MNDRELIKKLLHDLAPARRHLIRGMLFYVPVTIFSVVQPLIIGYAVQRGMLFGEHGSLLSITAVFFAVVGALAACELAQGIELQTTGQRRRTELIAARPKPFWRDVEEKVLRRFG